MDSSKFNLWRACLSFCFSDSVLAQNERKWIKEKQDTLNFTPEQKSILEKDLISPQDIFQILPLITRPSDRAFLVDQIRFLSKIDGTLSPEEKQLIEEVRNTVLSGVNLAELEDQVAADEMASYHKDEVYEVHNKASMFERLHKYLEKMLAPDYKLPRK